ncbi:FIG00553268: hypothetical protein [Cronobacter universalis NCTC 9529]|nr:FIG00553268: hypothetical protein [Cronobacter universalis NCTC 9529]
MSYSGSALLALAAASAVYAWIDGITLLNAAFISAVLALCWLAGGWLWREPQRQVSRAHLGAGIAFWLVALLQAACWAFTDISRSLALTLALLTLSALLWRAASRKAAWPDLAYAVWLLWPGMALMLIYQIVIDGSLVLAGWHSLVWCLALPCALWLLRRDASALPVRIQQGLHLSLFWMLLFAAGAETWWFTDSLPWGSGAWQTGIILAVSAAIVLLVNGAIRRGLWPCAQWPGDRVKPFLWGWAPLAWYALLFWWGNGLVLRTLAWIGDIPWQSDALWDSRLVQTTFALLWMLLALLVMVSATRKGARQGWFCGAGLLGVVIVKLMLVDSAGGGGLARAVAFIGVAVLVLIVGYFSPLPPPSARPVNARQGEAE